MSFPKPTSLETVSPQFTCFYGLFSFTPGVIFKRHFTLNIAYIYVLETKGKQQPACSKCTRKPSFCLKPKVCSSDFGSTLRQCIGLPTYNTSFKFIFHTSVGRLALASNSPVNKATIEYGVDNLFGCHRALYVGTSTYVDRKGKLYR